MNSMAHGERSAVNSMIRGGGLYSEFVSFSGHIRYVYDSCSKKMSAARRQKVRKIWIR